MKSLWLTNLFIHTLRKDYLSFTALLKHTPLRAQIQWEKEVAEVWQSYKRCKSSRKNGTYLTGMASCL